MFEDLLTDIQAFLEQRSKKWKIRRKEVQKHHSTTRYYEFLELNIVLSVLYIVVCIWGILGKSIRITFLISYIELSHERINQAVVYT